MAKGKYRDGRRNNRPPANGQFQPGQPDPHQGSFDTLLWRALVFNHIYEALVVTAEDGLRALRTAI